MPFTVSHIAAVLPVHKPLRRLGLISAATIGAMAPDLDLILPIRLSREQTHGWLALLTFCLPVGLAAWAIFQALIKPALMRCCPTGSMVGCLRSISVPGWGARRAWLYAALAVLVWSADPRRLGWSYARRRARCTHTARARVRRGSVPGGSTWLLYRWLQHGSTVLGAAVVCMALWLWVGHAKQPTPPPERRLSARERHRWMALYILIPVL